MSLKAFCDQCGNEADLPWQLIKPQMEKTDKMAQLLGAFVHEMVNDKLGQEHVIFCSGECLSAWLLQRHDLPWPP